MVMPVMLDLRDLAPPEPMERILEALATLPPGGCVEAITPFYPMPLLAILQADGFAFTVDAVEGGHRVRIVHVADAPQLDTADPAS